MSFIAASDILAGIKLAVKIYDYGYATENRADVRYTNFLNEILNFSILLRRLNDALKEAERRFEQRRPVLGLQPHRPLSAELERERVTIVGNYEGTLQECQALLQKNKQFRERDSNLQENLRHNLGLQEIRVDLLRKRLYGHTQKIRLVIDRLSLNLLTELDDKVDDILANTEQNLQLSKEIQLELTQFRASWLGYVSGHGIPVESASQGSHAVSENLSQRFLGALHEHAPTDMRDGIPLSQGFDALLAHFEQSSDEGSDQTPEGYLLFLKSRWLLDRLKQGEEYKRARPGFYYRRAINQVEQAILTRISQPGKLIAYDEDILLELPDQCFHVWPAPPAELEAEYRKPDLAMARGGEEKLASISLASDNMTEDSITILKSSDTHVRLVHESTPTSANGRILVTQHNMVVREDKLIPRYAFPTLESPCLELVISCRNVEEYFKFDSIEDLHKCQTALMGYDVSHDQEEVQCQFSNSLAYLDCKGRIQLWQEPIVLSAASPDPNSDIDFSSNKSGGDYSRHDSLGSSFAPATTIYATEGGYEGGRIKAATLVILTQVSDGKKKDRKKTKQFAAISVELGPNIFVDPSLCSCHRDPNCKIIVLRARRKPTFTVQYLLSGTDFQGQPNHNDFDILPLRLPRHPEFERKVFKKPTEYLFLAFGDLASKDLFLKELNLRFAVRDQQIEDQRNFERNIRYRQDHPTRRHQQQGPSLSPTGRNMSMSSYPSMSSLATQTQVRYRRSVASSATDDIDEDPEKLMSGALNGLHLEPVASSSSRGPQQARSARANSSSTARRSNYDEPGDSVQVESSRPKKAKTSKIKSLLNQL